MNKISAALLTCCLTLSGTLALAHGAMNNGTMHNRTGNNGTMEDKAHDSMQHMQ